MPVAFEHMFEYTEGTMTTLAAPPDADWALEAAVTPSDLLTQVRAARAAADAAQTQLFLLAVAWADVHPDLEHPVEDDPDSDWCGLPTLRWDAAAPFAAADHLSTSSGQALIRDALILRHRLPRTWSRVVAGAVPTWRARRIAQAVLGQPDDVCAYVDHEVADRAETIGPISLDRVLDEARLRLHAEERELEQLEALDARYVRLDEGSINHTGIADLIIRGDWADLTAFDESLSEVAAALARSDELLAAESLDVRRSIAVGVLADPERAAAVLAQTRPPSPQRRIVLNYHLSDAALLGVDPVGLDVDGRPLLDQLVRQWCGRDDVRLTIQPVLKMGQCPGPRAHEEERAAEAYAPSAADQLEVGLRDRTCVFAYCSRPARQCDCDHTVPYARGGPTCPCNLAPLCRHHHRLKTHAGWRYTALEPGTYLWTDPHGQQFLRTPDGTRDVTTDRS